MGRLRSNRHSQLGDHRVLRTRVFKLSLNLEPRQPKAERRSRLGNVQCGVVEVRDAMRDRVVRSGVGGNAMNQRRVVVRVYFAMSRVERTLGNFKRTKDQHE
jgi:hypothetical protein